MPIINIRNLDDSSMAKLRHVAAANGHSVEEEARQILRRALLAKAQKKGLGSRIHERFAEAGGVDLHLPPPSLTRAGRDFSEPNE